MKSIVGKVRRAIDSYNMISENDRIGVCVSGGKDSVFLLYSLCEIKRYYPKKFEIIAITLDPCFNGKCGDYSEIETLCSELNIKYVLKRTQLANIIFEYRKEKNPCSLCSRMRRGILHDLAKSNGCNKIALGHNLDDAAETFFMNLLNCGEIKCFSPVSYLSRKNLYMIRPLVFCEENKISSFVKLQSLPIIKSVCPADGKTERQAIKENFLNLEKEYPRLKKKIIYAMQKINLNNWGLNISKFYE